MDAIIYIQQLVICIFCPLKNSGYGFGFWILRNNEKQGTKFWWIFGDNEW